MTDGPSGLTEQFRGELRFLSNFAHSPVKITFGGVDYVLATGEHVFHGMKIGSAPLLSEEEKHDYLKALAADPSPKKAKYLGRSIKIDVAHWNNASIACMRRTIRLKFDQNPELAQKLVATKDLPLTETNTWGDRKWGVDMKTGEGQNLLGKLLMEERARRSKVRILITGSRGWNDQARLFSVLDEVAAGRPTILVSGNAHGADALAESWARKRGHEVEAHPADWDKYGPPAGHIRNQLMADLGADIVVAFRVGKSPGTTGMMKIAKKAGLPVRLEQQD